MRMFHMLPSSTGKRSDRKARSSIIIIIIIIIPSAAHQDPSVEVSGVSGSQVSATLQVHHDLLPQSATVACGCFN
jgi:hypothetical protein